ncbi:hypothetical protein MMC27_002869 [Xylographa pallens]|nr:hypothetical protein [Xylographa pallens]
MSTTNSPIGQHRRSWRHHGTGAAMDGDIAEGRRFSRADPKKRGGISAKRGMGKSGHSQLKHGGITEAVPQRIGAVGFPDGCTAGCQIRLGKGRGDGEKERKEKARWSVETGVEIAATGYAANDE